MIKYIDGGFQMNTALWISVVGAIFCAIIAVFIENKEK